MGKVESHFSPLEGGPVEFSQEMLTPEEAVKRYNQVCGQGGRVDIETSTVHGLLRTTVIMPASPLGQHVVPSEFRD